MQIKKDNERKFLIGLEKLTRETGLVIAGCGCCNSPFLRELSVEELVEEAGYGVGINDSISWLSPNYKTEWRKHSDSIVKAMGIKIKQKVRILEGASAWMKSYGYWPDYMPETIDGMYGIVVGDYTEYPGTDCHYAVDFDEYGYIGVHPHWLIPITEGSKHGY